MENQISLGLGTTDVSQIYPKREKYQTSVQTSLSSRTWIFSEDYTSKEQLFQFGDTNTNYHILRNNTNKDITRDW